MKEIAVIKLAPGKVAYYDDYTKIHLTLASPTATIYEGMNLKRIKNSVKFGVLQVVVGSLNTDVTEIPVETEKPVVVHNIHEAEKTIDENADAKIDKTDAPEIEITETIVDAQTEPAAEEEKHDEVIAEEITEEAEIAETVETEAKPKRGRKKNAEKETAE